MQKPTFAGRMMQKKWGISMQDIHPVRFVLVETTHPGNIGSAARAMKTMGFHDLVLVNPKGDPASEEAVALASSASDVLKAATICSSIEEAIADCSWVIATSMRSRYLDWPVRTPREMAKQLVSEEGPIAIVFGRERNGLTNDELQLAHLHVSIPSAYETLSLNLAQAVQVMAYECRSQLLDAPTNQVKNGPYATSAELEGLYEHWEAMLQQVGFLKGNAEQLTMVRFKRLFQRARLERIELNMLRGVCKDVLKAAP